MTFIPSSRISIPASVSFIPSAGSSIPSARPDVEASGMSVSSALSSVTRAVILRRASGISGIDARTSSRSTMTSFIDDGISGTDAGSSVTASSPKITAAWMKITAGLPDITAAVTRILGAVTEFRAGFLRGTSTTTLLPLHRRHLPLRLLDWRFDRREDRAGIPVPRMTMFGAVGRAEHRGAVEQLTAAAAAACESARAVRGQDDRNHRGLDRFDPSAWRRGGSRRHEICA